MKRVSQCTSIDRPLSYPLDPWQNCLKIGGKIILNLILLSLPPWFLLYFKFCHKHFVTVCKSLCQFKSDFDRIIHDKLFLWSHQVWEKTIHVWKLCDVLNFNFQMCTQFPWCFLILSQYLLLAKKASNLQTCKILNVWTIYTLKILI